MSKGPGIMDMPETRVAPRRPIKDEAKAAGRNERPAFGARAPGRVPVATYLEPEQLAIVQALLARLRGEGEKRRVTMQEALAKALQKWCADHKVELPSEI